jgi:hypothetical protein
MSTKRRLIANFVLVEIDTACVCMCREGVARGGRAHAYIFLLLTAYSTTDKITVLYILIFRLDFSFSK